MILFDDEFAKKLSVGLLAFDGFHSANLPVDFLSTNLAKCCSVENTSE